MSNIEIGTRMKEQYEVRSQTYLPRRTYVIIRVDGKAFHTYTRNCQRPFDPALAQIMDETAVFMCSQIQGAKLGFVQSDEISILLTDFDEINTDMWFDGGVQKIVSVSASLATAGFEKARPRWSGTLEPGALFDSRVFIIPDRIEVANYFVWRQQDASRNSVQMLAQSHYTQPELHGKNSADLHDMIHAKGGNWNYEPVRFKRGAAVIDKQGWFADQHTPVFTAEREYLTELIPNYPS